MVEAVMDPAFVTLLLNRFGNGPTADDFVSLPKRGLNDWLHEQLSPPDGDDAGVKTRLSAMQYHIGFKGNDKYPPVDEMRPLQYLDKPIEAAWPLLDKEQPRDGAEKRRPRDEVLAATCLRAVYSKYQLREAAVAFWHDHFNVNTNAGDQIQVAFPTYDRDVIRPHALGNFRELLEAVATSTAMLYYLSNRSSRAGAANENYGRELFELHTLGRDAYLNDQYDKWREVPGAAAGKPEGYIDQDVYESARAFTGWTVEDGAAIDGQRKLPATGKFTYVENWHDGYQKRVLARDFDPFASAMADGRKVLDLVSSHPATAQHMVSKLCLRFIGPNASPALMAELVKEWQKLSKSSTQIAQIISLIIRSPEFAASRGAKVKRPLALAAGFARITHMDFIPTEPFVNGITNAGQRLFTYPTPNGAPDVNSYYIGTSNMRQRWALLLNLAQNNWKTGVCDPTRVVPKTTNTADYINQWLGIFGAPQDANMATSIAAAAGLPPVMIGNLDTKRLATAVALAAMSPNYQST
jgi:uncharacterized protein (DUF1800 family)